MFEPTKCVLWVTPRCQASSYIFVFTGPNVSLARKTHLRRCRPRLLSPLRSSTFPPLTSTTITHARASALSHLLQGKYIVLDSGNELVNRLRGVLSGFFLGVVSGRVFVADITYQKDTKEGLLSALFEGPGYQVTITSQTTVYSSSSSSSSSRAVQDASLRT